MKGNDDDSEESGGQRREAPAERSAPNDRRGGRNG
jgi:hypothetical protein